MLLRKTARLLTVLGIAAGAGGIGLAAPASACACGGAAWPTATSGQVADETALVAWDGQRETIDMRLGLRSSGPGAALLVPTPTPATVTLGNPGTFTELEQLTAPTVVTERKWFGDFRLGWGSAAPDGAGAAPGGGAPTVLDRVQLGPVEATTFTGGDLTGIREWLSHNGYEMREEVLATMPAYLDEGWSFVALRLTTSAALNGALDPVRLSFAADRLVYPMRMSRAATHEQTVRLYVLGPHEIQREDHAITGQSTSYFFAGRVEAHDPDLKQLSSSGNDYLTGIFVTVWQPAALSSDFLLVRSPADVPFREEQHRVEYVRFLGIPAGFAILLTALLFGPALGVLVIVTRGLRRAVAKAAV